MFTAGEIDKVREQHALIGLHGSLTERDVPTIIRAGQDAGVISDHIAVFPLYTDDGLLPYFLLTVDILGGHIRLSNRLTPAKELAPEPGKREADYLLKVLAWAHGTAERLKDDFLAHRGDPAGLL